MNVWRRLVNRAFGARATTAPAITRVAAMLFVVAMLGAGTVWADVDQIRVKVGPANVYQRPETGADVLAVVPEGTILEVLKRDGDWYWVMLPRDAYGTRRGGYIAAYLVEPIARKGTAEPAAAPPPPSMPGARPFPSDAQPAPRRPKSTPDPRAATGRYLVSVGGGAQSSSRAFADTAWFPMNDETTTYHAFYSTPRASALDASIGLRLASSFVFGIAYWRSSPIPAASITASVPHPLAYNSPRPASASGVGSTRAENDFHFQLTWLMPVTRRADLSIFGGPSVFFLRQDLVTLDAQSFRDAYPFDTVSMTGTFHSVRRSRAALGANAGFDVTVMVWRYIGVGATARYAYGSTNLPTVMDGYTTTVKLGGVQGSGGVRVRF